MSGLPPTTASDAEPISDERLMDLKESVRLRAILGATFVKLDNALFAQIVARLDQLSAEVAAKDALIEEARPHVAKIANCIRINNEMGRVVTGQTEAAAALRDVFARAALTPRMEAET